MSVDVEASEVIEAAARDRSLTVVSQTPQRSFDESMQRVRVLFGPGEDPAQRFPSGFPIQVGERICHVRVFIPQHRKTADAISRASSGERVADALTGKELREI
eukprot:gene9442-7584_t